MANIFGGIAGKMSAGRKMAMRYHDATVASAIMSAGGGGVWKHNMGRSLAINAGMGAAYGGATDGDNRFGGAVRGAFMGMGAGIAYRGALHAGVRTLGSGRAASLMNRGIRARSLGYRSAKGFAMAGGAYAKGFSGHMYGLAKSRFAKKTVA